MIVLKNKGAMFGLDARIALAIFTALSIIGGAALYSAIQDAKVQQIISKLREMEKGLGAYLLDNGVDIPAQTSFKCNAEMRALAANKFNLDTWNGPYLEFIQDWDYNHSQGRALDLKGNALSLYKMIKSPTMWILSTSGYPHDAFACTATDCYYWFAFSVTNHTSNETAILNKIDEIIDDGDGYDSGRVMWQTKSGHYIIFYRSFPPINNT